MMKYILFVSIAVLITSCSTPATTVTEKQKDTTIVLHDIWALETIDGAKLEFTDQQRRPQLEINPTTKKVMGNDGCNNFMGEIKTVDNKQLVLGPLAGTKMACPDMSITNKLNQRLSNIQSYKVADLRLRLYDKSGNELLVFRKVD